MRTAIIFGAAALAVSGCALLPAPVQIASLALDGVSFVVSKKSVADHVISLAMQQDCALWRGVTESRLCYPDGAPTIEARDPGLRVVRPLICWCAPFPRGVLERRCRCFRTYAAERSRHE